MLILTEENKSYNLTNLPTTVDNDLHYCILDNSTISDPDYLWLPLVFMESFNTPTLKLRVGEKIVNVPVDWQILIGEPDHGDLEVIAFTSLNDRNFKAFTFNPLKSFKPEFSEIEILDVFPETQWFVPKLKNGQLLAVPITQGENPLCIYITKEITKNLEIVNYRLAW